MVAQGLLVTSNKVIPSQAHFKPISPISAYFSVRHVTKCVAKYVFLFSKSIILNPVTIGHSQSVENALAGLRYSLPHSTRTVLLQYLYSFLTVPRLSKYEGTVSCTFWQFEPCDCRLYTAVRIPGRNSYLYSTVLCSLTRLPTSIGLYTTSLQYL